MITELKRLLCIVAVVIMNPSCEKKDEGLLGEYVELPDKNFEQILINDSLDTEYKLDGRLLLRDAKNITHIKITSYVESLEGISKFENLRNLVLTTAQTLQLDLSNNLLLDILRINGTQIPDFDVSSNSNLRMVTLIDMGLSKIDFRANRLLGTIKVYDNPLKNLYINENVERLEFYNTQIKYIDLSRAWNLSYLDCHSSLLDSLNIESSPKIDFLDCSDNFIKKLTLPNKLCQGNGIGELHIENNRGLIADICVCDDFQADLHLKRKLYIPYHKWEYAWTKDKDTNFKKCSN